MTARHYLSAALAMTCLASTPALAGNDRSSGRQAQDKGMAQIPVCTRRLGTVSIVEPERQWWTDMGVGSPEAILKVFVMKSGCFGLVDRNQGLAARGVERALADSGELQQRSNIGRGQVKAADYAIVPDIVSGNNNSGGGGVGAALGGIGRHFGGLAGLAGNINVSKKEANVTLTLVNTRTTEQERLTEGYARKSDVSFGGGGGGYGGGVFGAVGGTGYTNTELGQVLVLAYLDAYTKLVQQLGGLPLDPSAAAPRAN